MYRDRHTGRCPRWPHCRQPGNAGHAYSEVHLRSGPLPALKGATHYTYALSMNGQPLEIDGLPPEAYPRRFDAAQGLDLSFGLENLNASGRQGGFEDLSIELRFLAGDQLLRQSRLRLRYVALRPIDGPRTVSDGDLSVQWSAVYHPGRAEDAFQIFITSSPDGAGLQAQKDRFDAARLTASLAGREQAIVAVLRPPLEANRNYGLNLGLRQPNGQIKFTFDDGTSVALCQALNALAASQPQLVRRDSYRRTLDGRKGYEQCVRFAAPLMGALYDALNAQRRLLLGVLRSLLPPEPPAAIDRGAASRSVAVTLGRSTVRLELSGADDARHLFINLHENERTSVHAARGLLATRPDSRLIVLRGQGRRHIVFWIGVRPYLFDPNRIFSDTGIEATLRYHGACSPAAHAAVAGLRDALIAALQPEHSTLIVALHNNGIGHYTVDSYRPGGTHASQAQAVHLSAAADAGDFFLVNQPAACKALRDSGFGVVLQRPDADDDGSLSQRFVDPRPLYVNVEARHGHLAEQRQMLATVLDRAARLTSA